MPTITRRLAVVATAASLALAVAGCGSSASPTPPSVSAKFARGEANVTITGGYTATYKAPFINGRTVGSGTFVSLQYGAVQTGSLTYQGPAIPGTYATLRTGEEVTTLALTVVLMSGDEPSDSFASMNGECSITILEYSQARGDATFTCTGLANLDGTVTIDASGSFYAEP
jgi:hypothetical protein